MASGAAATTYYDVVTRYRTEHHGAEAMRRYSGGVTRATRGTNTLMRATRCRVLIGVPGIPCLSPIHLATVFHLDCRDCGVDQTRRDTETRRNEMSNPHNPNPAILSKTETIGSYSTGAFCP